MRRVTAVNGAQSLSSYRLCRRHIADCCLIEIIHGFIYKNIIRHGTWYKYFLQKNDLTKTYVFLVSVFGLRSVIGHCGRLCFHSIIINMYVYIYGFTVNASSLHSYHEFATSSSSFCFLVGHCNGSICFGPVDSTCVASNFWYKTNSPLP